MDELSKQRSPIAIVGIGCRFPGNANGPVSFWEMLVNKVDAIGPVPSQRWHTESYWASDPNVPGRSSAKEGGFLSLNPTCFDAHFFGISPREASKMDPQQRLLLEVAYEAMEDCGKVDQFIGGNTGVFMGGFVLDFQVLQLAEENRRHISNHTGVGVTMAMLANRLSHAFDLRGPSIALDTACSASLTALHYASQSLWNKKNSRDKKYTLH